MYGRSMMIYSSPWAKFKGTKSNGRIHRYEASIFGDIIIDVSVSTFIYKCIQVQCKYVCICSGSFTLNIHTESRMDSLLSSYGYWNFS